MMGFKIVVFFREHRMQNIVTILNLHVTIIYDLSGNIWMCDENVFVTLILKYIVKYY